MLNTQSFERLFLVAVLCGCLLLVFVCHMEVRVCSGEHRVRIPSLQWSVVNTTKSVCIDLSLERLSLVLGLQEICLHYFSGKSLGSQYLLEGGFIRLPANDIIKAQLVGVVEQCVELGRERESRVGAEALQMIG